MFYICRYIWPAAAVVSLFVLAFLGKAYTIDDTLFLLQARQVLADPMHPTAFDVIWTEHPMPTRMSEIMVSGPTMAYLLAPAALADGAEWVTRLTQLALLLTALFATAALARRLGVNARAMAIGGLLLASAPAVLAMATTAMPDVAAMTLSIVAIERLIAWRDTRRWPAAAIAALAFAAAILARSHAVLLLPPAALLLCREPWRARGWRPATACVPFLVALLLAGAVLVVTRDPLGGSASIASAAQRYANQSFVGGNLVAFFSHWTVVLPVAIPWLLVRGRRVLFSPVLFAGAGAAALTLWATQPPARLAIVSAAAGLGLAALVDIVVDAWRRRDAVQLGLGVMLFAAIPVSVYPHLPAKYLLISAPAAALLIGRAMESRIRSGLWLKVGGTVAAGVVLGAMIVRADAAFADLGRRAATELIRPNVAAGRTVWFAGHWGFQWYAERAGARCLALRGPQPAAGDLIVSSENALGGIVNLFNPRTFVAAIADEAPGGRIMSRRGGAGFYSNAWGYLPWTWSDDVRDRYTLWRLEARGDSVGRPSR